MPTPSNLLLAASELLMKSSVILLAASLATYALRRLSAALNVTSRRATLIGMSRRSKLEYRMLAAMDEQRNLCQITRRTATIACVPVALGLALCSSTLSQAESNSAMPADATTAPADPFAKIIIDKVDFSNATLTEAVGFLRLKAREQGNASFDIVITKMPVPEPRISLSLRKIPITQAVKYVAAAAGLRERRDSQGFVLE